MTNDVTSDKEREPYEDALYVWQKIVGDFDSVQERDESLAQYIWQEATRANPQPDELQQLRKIAHLAANLEMVHNDGRLAQALREWYNPANPQPMSEDEAVEIMVGAYREHWSQFRHSSVESHMAAAYRALVTRGLVRGA